jgi:hypothetical protein
MKQEMNHLQKEVREDIKSEGSKSRILS